MSKGPQFFVLALVVKRNYDKPSRMTEYEKFGDTVFIR